MIEPNVSPMCDYLLVAWPPNRCKRCNRRTRYWYAASWRASGVMSLCRKHAQPHLAEGASYLHDYRRERAR